MASAIMAHYQRGLARAKSAEGEALLMQAVEASLMGLGIGFIEAQSKTGLDIGVGTYKLPLDLAVGGLGLAASLFAPLDRESRDILSRMSAVAWGIGVYRKSSAFVKSKMTAHGDTDDFDADLGEDPVVAAARML